MGFENSKIGLDVIYNRDCLEGMADIPDGSVDMILCDLPYGVTNADSEAGKWDSVIPFAPMWAHFTRVTKPNAAIVLFAQGMFTANLMTSRPDLWKYNLVWDKFRVTGHLNAKLMPLRQHEDICVFYRELPTYHPQMVYAPDRRNHSRGKQEKEATNRCYGKVRAVEDNITDWKYPTSIVAFEKPHDADTFHPTQKSLDLCRWLVRTYTDRGETVLDACMGSGTTAVAALAEDRHFIGFERDAGYCERATRRVERARAAGFQESFDFGE